MSGGHAFVVQVYPPPHALRKLPLVDVREARRHKLGGKIQSFERPKRSDGFRLSEHIKITIDIFARSLRFNFLRRRCQ